MRQLHAFTAIRNAFQYGSQLGSLVLFAGMGAVAIDVIPIAIVFVLIPLGFLLGATYGVARYRAFAYEIKETTLHLRSGVFHRQNREIPLRRVQNVDVEQSFTQRILGVAVVRFETAGGGSTEGILRVVDANEAERLQVELRHRKRELTVEPAELADTDIAGDEPAGSPVTTTESSMPTQPYESRIEYRCKKGSGPSSHQTDGQSNRAANWGEWADKESEGKVTAAGVSYDASFDDSVTDDVTVTGGVGRAAGTGAPERTTLFRLSISELLVLSAVTFRWGTIPLVLFSVPIAGDFIIDLASNVLRSGLGSGSLSTYNPIAIGLLLGGIVTVVLAAWLVSGAITFAQYYGFELARIEDELVYERGLIQRYSGTIPLDKVQALRIRENVFMRKFDFAALAVETAGYAGADGGGQAPSAIPLAKRSTVVSLADDIGNAGHMSIRRPPKRARRRYTGRYMLAVGGITLGLVGIDRVLFPLGLLWIVIAICALMAVPAAHLTWAHRGYELQSDHFVARSGFWRRTTRIVPYYRLQTVLTVRSPFQRRWRLGSVIADTAASSTLASSDATAHDIDRTTANQLHDELRDRLRIAVAKHQSQS